MISKGGISRPSSDICVDCPICNIYSDNSEKITHKTVKYVLDCFEIYHGESIQMLNKVLICIVMLAVVFGCANQQKDTADKPSEETEQTDVTTAEESTEETEQTEADVAVEEISLAVTGMT